MNVMHGSDLSRLTVQALERMAFVLAEPVEEDPGPLSPSQLHALLSFRSDAEQGDLLLSADAGFVCELASSLLGVETSEVTPEQQGVEALVELANVLAGECVVMLGGQSIPFQMGLPVALQAAEAMAHTEGEAAPGDLVCAVAGDQGRLRLELRRRAR